MESGTCLQRLLGTVRKGAILKDVSMEVHGGELAAVLGSKGKYIKVLQGIEVSLMAKIFSLGSGKRALLEVISRRAQGPTRGQILLNGVPMSMRLFQVI